MKGRERIKTGGKVVERDAVKECGDSRKRRERERRKKRARLRTQSAISKSKCVNALLML